MKTSLVKNLNWFLNSGVMIPESGIWGVAERVAVCEGNAAIEHMKNAFPAWMQYDGYCVMEQRRADCNFETAYLFLLAGEVLGETKYDVIAENLLDYLYFRSGLLNRSQKEYQAGSWNWSHIKRESIVYFDDEAWCVFLPLQIAAKYPELDRKYGMKTWAVTLGEELRKGVVRVMEANETDSKGNWRDPDRKWLGQLNLPHWGSLACMALARVFRENHSLEYSDAVLAYHQYLETIADKLIVSELAYALIGACAACSFLGGDYYKTLAIRFGERIRSKMDPLTGNIPAEHYEAPVGKHLVDTIYTVNWALLGMQALARIAPEFADDYRKLRSLILEIQDSSPEPQFAGCWRGMYDINTRSWGGGDRFEGGAGSIYTGWTNAPVSSAIALDLLDRSLFS